ncbi:hypothetical protein HOO68_00780 [Candidatus Gracilibacteria bacterium]|nr:hypothetical protein [Candidatus Gracilibacteria bacterium]
MLESYGDLTNEIDPRITQSIIGLQAKQPIPSDEIGRIAYFPEVFLGSGELSQGIGDTVRNIIHFAYIIQ